MNPEVPPPLRPPSKINARISHTGQYGLSTATDTEILLGEDDSSAGTREICQEYADKHPDLIRLFFHKREDNLEIHGRATGRRNLEGPSDSRPPTRVDHTIVYTQMAPITRTVSTPSGHIGDEQERSGRAVTFLDIL